MQIGIYSIGVSDSSTKSLKKLLESSGVQSFSIMPKAKPKPADCIIVLGGDRGVRNYFHHTLDVSTPVLGIGEAEASGFLAQIELKEFPTYLKRLKKQDFTIDKVTRLGVKIDGKNVYPVLNDEIGRAHV